MTHRTSEDLQRWARAWDLAGAHLERERVERLRTISDEEAREVIARIFGGPVPPPVERETGLIEQQRLFKELA